MTSLKTIADSIDRINNQSTAYNQPLEIAWERAGLEVAANTDVSAKIPGIAKHSNVTLKRGVIDTVGLAALRAQAATMTVTIQLLDENREAVMAWRIRDARIVKLTGPTMNASGNEVAIESLELVYEGVELV